MMKNPLFWGKIEDIKKISQLLRDNRLVIGTSDTVLGFLAPASREGEMLLNQAKGRVDKPYLVLSRSANDVQGVVDCDPVLFNKLSKCWPGPVTIIFKKRPESAVLPHASTIGIRIPAHPGLQCLLAEVPLLYSTSANRSGDPVATSLEEVHPEIMRVIDAVIIDEEGLGRSVPSTILDASGDQLKLVREGVYSVLEIERITGLVIAK